MPPQAMASGTMKKKSEIRLLLKTGAYQILQINNYLNLK